MDGCRNRSQRSGLSHSERFARLGLTSSLPSIDDTILHDARRAPMTLDRAGEHVSDPRPTGIQRPCSPRAWCDVPSERGAGIGPTPKAWGVAGARLTSCRRPRAGCAPRSRAQSRATRCSSSARPSVQRGRVVRRELVRTRRGGGWGSARGGRRSDALAGLRSSPRRSARPAELAIRQGKANVSGVRAQGETDARGGPRAVGRSPRNPRPSACPSRPKAD